MKDTAPVDRALLIEGLGKGLKVIECFSDDHPRLTATEAAALAGLTRTAARRYLVSLVHYGYADTDGKHYWLGPKVLRLGQSYLEASRLPRLVQPFLQRLSMATGETANLSVLDGHEIVYLVRSNSPRVVSIGFHPGARMPAHVVAPGFAILSTFDPDRLDAWIAEHALTRFTPHTIADELHQQQRALRGVSRTKLTFNSDRDGERMVQALGNLLANAIAHNRVHHAYLFCGARGLGKTKPSAPNADEDGRRKNRRVEMAPVPRAAK